MRKILPVLLALLCFCVNSHAQIRLKNARLKSWETLVFRIPADSAASLLNDGALNPDRYLDKQPVTVFRTDNLPTETLPIGHYLFFSLVNNNLVYEYFNQTAVQVRPVNNNHRVQLELRDSTGALISHARVWVNGHESPYQPALAAFQVNGRHPDNALVKIAVPGDTSFVRLTAMQIENNHGWSPWWNRLKSSRAGKLIRWPGKKIERLFTRNYYGWPYRKAPRRPKGYMVFNKALYKTGDTVKFKAYVLDKHNRRLKRSLAVRLSYQLNGRNITLQLASLKASFAGSYTHEFVLGDSLPSDLNYRIGLWTGIDKEVLNGSFRIEDYLNDEVASHSLRASSDKFYRGDSMVFTLTAKDAAGLPVMDGRARFYLLARDSESGGEEEVFVPDTIYQSEKNLAADDDTRFVIHTSQLPDAALSIEAVAEFLNGNNEIHTETRKVEYDNVREQIAISQDGNHFNVEYRLNGVPTDTTGTYSTDEYDHEYTIRYPARIQLDPFAERYLFDAGNAGNEIEPGSTMYQPAWQHVQGKDSCGFIMENPYGLLIHYTVIKGKKILAAKADTASSITWKGRLQKNTTYEVLYKYFWQGTEQSGRFNIYALDKLLTTKFDQKETVYPGETDTVRLTITDRKGRPAANVNLTAVTYNAQHRNNIKVPEPPYLQRMRYKARIKNDGFEQEPAERSGKFLLADYDAWRSRFAIDTMAYYQLLKPSSPYRRLSIPTADALPQVSVHMVKHGVPKEIHLLFVNNQFAWYNNATEQPAYVFHGVHGYNRFSVRLDSMLVMFDSIYLQPYYKHEISFDLDSLPSGTVVQWRKPFLYPEEKKLLESSLLRFERDGNADNAWVWQDEKLVWLSESEVTSRRPDLINNLTTYGEHLVGPFRAMGEVQYYKPGKYDLLFPVEGNYRYRISERVARLERMPLFRTNDPVPLKKVEETEWIIGDTLPAIPRISYVINPAPEPFLNETEGGPAFAPDHARVEVELPGDSSFSYLVLYNDDTVLVRKKDFSKAIHVQPGEYHLVMLTRSLKYLSREKIKVRPQGTTLVRFNNPDYRSTNAFIEDYRNRLLAAREKAKREYFLAERIREQVTSPDPKKTYPAGNATIEGRIIDRSGGEPMAGVSVTISGYEGGVVSDKQGRFRLPGVKPGRYYLVVSMIGYSSQGIDVEVREAGYLNVPVEMNAGKYSLDEVVVVAYGIQRKSSVTSSISTISGNEISGRVAGVAVSAARANTRVVIRGVSSGSGSNEALYVVNGIIMDNIPDESVMAGAQVEIIKNAGAVALYGARAANGVIVITTAGFQPKAMRDQFRDYASWQPDLFTDKRGQVSYAITYPDNLTGWETYVVGMDRKRRFTKAHNATRSFKPVVAQLFAPSFMIEGDSSVFTGKLVNYTDAEKNAGWKFSSGQTAIAGNTVLASNTSQVRDNPVAANNTDTITAVWSLDLAGGYSDGETKNIPVFRKGTMETVGKFWVIDHDTTISFQPVKGAGEVYLFAVNNTLDLVLKELDQLKDYPWFCLEQTTSKLRGLVLERQIRARLGHPFKHERMITYLTDKLQSAQSYDGGWAWWKGGDSDPAITHYIMRSLVELPVDALMQTNIRSGILYLQHELERTSAPGKKLDILHTMSEVKHQMDYRPYLDQIVFDSLSVYQQWQYTRVLQNIGEPVGKFLSQLVSIRQEDMFGSIHWGTDNYSWHSNAMAATVLAFRVLSAAGGHEAELKAIVGYFLSRRTKGRWGNTVESAAVTSAILPFILKGQSGFTDKARLLINGTNIVDSFPATLRLNADDEITISRTGGGLLFLTASQDTFNVNPQPVRDKFEINTWFEVAGRRTSFLSAGTNAIMKITVDVKKDAEYVQFEIPIPAGCTYASKPQLDPRVHIEYLKDKQVFFMASVPTGKYDFEIRLEPRYTGVYNLNPAKSYLMYFPVFYGQTGVKSVPIEK